MRAHAQELSAQIVFVVHPPPVGGDLSLSETERLPVAAGICVVFVLTRTS